MPPIAKGKAPAKVKTSPPSRTPVRGKPAQQKSRHSEPRSAKKHTPAPSPKNSMPWDRISPERRLDLLGGVMALVGLGTALMLLSPQRSSLPGLWVSLLYQVAGWGMFLLPVALIVFGLWLIFRKIEKLPRFSLERFIGLLLLYLVFLTTLHLGGGRGLVLAQKGEGGGHIGALFEGLLTAGFGVAGAAVVLAALGILALIMAFDLSITEIIADLSGTFQKLQDGRRRRAMDREQNEALEDLPPEFEPLKDSQEAELKSRLPAPIKSRESQPSVVARQASLSGRQSVMQNPTGPVVTTGTTPSLPVWVLPKIDEILDPVTPVAIQANVDHERAKVIEDTLASFGAPGHVVEIHRGPTVTQFGVEPDFVESRSGRMRVRVGRISGLADDLALALAAPRIRIQAPVPGRSFVGIEVPNTEISRVSLREVLESEAFIRLRSSLRFALGKDVSGRSMAYDLSSMPHLLIAGTTGSGKSVCVNSILCCLLMNNTPQELRLVMVDPKRVELTGYNGIPHLLGPVVVDTERVIGALQWMLREMDSRYHKFASSGTRNIQEYNKKAVEKLPYLVVVVDELADLMMLAPDETERCITRLAQLARATGIHLILATQRPSVNVVTGLIKANFPARVAFAVASGVDSRVILDQPGAERLLGRGDMLFQAPDASAPVRLQGVYVSDTEIQRLVDFWRVMAAKTSMSSGSNGEIIDPLPNGVPLKQIPLWEEKPEEPQDALLNEAIDLVRREGRASVTMLQRRMRIGYTRAARMVDMMEAKKIIGPVMPNSQVREVLDYGPTAPPEDD